MIGRGRLVLAILALCVAAGPLIGLAAGMVLEVSIYAVDWLLKQIWSLSLTGGLALDDPFFPEKRFLLRPNLALVPIAYVLGGVQAVAGGLFLGRRFSRVPPADGPTQPLAAGLVLGLVFAAMVSPRGLGGNVAESLLAFAIPIVIHVAAAAGCWALARLLVRRLRRKTA